MRDRIEVSSFIDKQMKKLTPAMFTRKNNRAHYGKQELKDLLDYVYEEPPTSEGEHLACVTGTEVRI